ncbi:MAG: hypothetical protein WEB88_16275 [Gemmatimonadota bacterium]
MRCPSYRATCCTFVLAVATACGDAAPGKPTYTAYDSAGIQVVVSQLPAWGAEDGWQVAAEPALHIGAVDGDSVYLFERIAGLTRLSDGRITVLDAGASQLRWYDPSGRFTMATGRSGGGPGEFRYRPTGLVRGGGDTLTVSVLGNWEAVNFTADGEYAGTSVLARGRQAEVLDSLFGCPRSMGPLPDRTVLACVSRGRVRNHHADVHRGSHWLIRMPLDVAWTDTIGTYFGFSTGAWFGAPATAVAAGGDPLTVFVGDPAFFEIAAFTDGAERDRLMAYPAGLRAVEPADVDAYEVFLRQWAAERPEGSYAADLMDRPAAPHMPGFTSLHYDPEGYVWAVAFTPAYEESHRAWIFSVDGPLQGSVALPPDFEIHQIGSDYLLGIWRDDMDVEHVRMYALERDG